MISSLTSEENSDCRQPEELTTGARDALPANAEEVAGRRTAESVREVGNLAELEAEEGSAGSAPVDGNRRSGAR